jgi:hypothetical protein
MASVTVDWVPLHLLAKIEDNSVIINYLAM